MRRVVVSLIAAAGLVVLGATSALAGGHPVVNVTHHFSNVTQTFPSSHPCTGEPGLLTITFSGVSHVMVQPDGTGHFTETDRGTFAFDTFVNGAPDGDTDFSGGFVSWDGGNGLFDQNGNPTGKGEMSFTLNGSGTNLDTGAPFRFHNSGHAVFDQFANPKVEFFHAQCNGR